MVSSGYFASAREIIMLLVTLHNTALVVLILSFIFLPRMD